ASPADSRNRRRDQRRQSVDSDPSHPLGHSRHTPRSMGRRRFGGPAHSISTHKESVTESDTPERLTSDVPPPPDAPASSARPSPAHRPAGTGDAAGRNGAGNRPGPGPACTCPNAPALGRRQARPQRKVREPGRGGAPGVLSRRFRGNGAPSSP